jgi:sortase A
MKNRNRKGLGFIITGLLAISAALFLTIYNFYEDYHSAQNINKILEQLDTTDDTEADPDTDMPQEQIDDQDYIGRLEIPTLDLELPIISEWSYKSLKIAPCRYSGSAYDGNFVILAHNYSSHFGRLMELSIGDEITFTDMDGNIFTYEVTEKEILQPEDVEEMESGDWDLTLFTCTVGGKSRVTVRCEKKET